jgi:hypothetical protein
MDHWGDPWAEDGGQKGISNGIEGLDFGGLKKDRGQVVSGWEDDAGWGDFEAPNNGWTEGGVWDDAEGSDSTAQKEDIEVKPEEELDSTGDVTNDVAATAEQEDGPNQEKKVGAHVPLAKGQNAAQEKADSAISVRSSEDYIPQEEEEMDAEEGDAVPTELPAVGWDNNAEELAPTESQRVPLDSSLVSAESESKKVTVTSQEEALDEHTASDLRDGRPADVEQELQEQTALKIDDDQPMVHAADTHHEPDMSLTAPEPSVFAIGGDEDSPERTVRKHRGPKFEYDKTLVDRLFSVSKSQEPPKIDREDELISSTSERKSWYRIRRKETLREFNKGDTDNSYVRIAWPHSKIREETLKIVTRWHNEERVNGKTIFGARPGAAFGWDSTPTPSQHGHRPTSSANRSASSPTTLLPPLRKASDHRRVPSSLRTPLDTSSPVAHFSWSTSPTSATTPSVPIGQSPLSPKPKSPIRMTSAISSEPRKPASKRKRDSRPLSMIIRKTPSITQGSHTRSSSASMTAPEVNAVNGDSTLRYAGPDRKTNAGLPENMLSSETQPAFPPKDNTKLVLTNLDTSAASIPNNEAGSANDDDEWGEMVQSPAISTGPTNWSFDALDTPSDGFQAQPTTSQQRLSLESTKSSPISTVRPSATRAPAPARSPETRQRPVSMFDLDFSVFERASSPAPAPLRRASTLSSKPSASATSSSPQVVSAQSVQAPPSSSTSLFDADFSIFETPAPPLPSAGRPPNTKPPSTTLPQDIPTIAMPRPPPPKQPSFSPSQLAIGEEAAVKSILMGLPDLSYMLR